MMKKNIHIGSVIHRIVKEKGIPPTKLAKALCCSKSNIYSIYKRRVIDYELLLLISEVLEYDFLELCYDIKSNSDDFIIILETNKLKKNELSADESIKIIKILDIQQFIKDKSICSRCQQNQKRV